MLKNTIENKYKFIAQYWWTDTGVINGIKHFRVNPNHICDIEYLELTPLSQITDEDAIEVAKICGQDIFTEIERLKDKIIIHPSKKFCKKNYYEARQDITICFENCTVYYDNGESYEDNYNYDLGLEAYDYLRSKSYLIPYNGTPTETLIEYGWAKLKN